MGDREKIFNVPNLISLYRLATFPLVLWLAYSGRQHLFAIFFCINLVTDILDGLIARILRQSTLLGARLDSIADVTLFVSAVYGIAIFKWGDMRPYSLVVYFAIGVYCLPYITAYLRFRKFPSLHLYSSKIGAYALGAFFFVLFTWGFYAWIFFAAIAIGIGSWLEEVAVLLALQDLKANAKGLYWVLRG